MRLTPVLAISSANSPPRSSDSPATSATTRSWTGTDGLSRTYRLRRGGRGRGYELCEWVRSRHSGQGCEGKQEPGHVQRENEGEVRGLMYAGVLLRQDDQDHRRHAAAPDQRRDPDPLPAAA